MWLTSINVYLIFKIVNLISQVYIILCKHNKTFTSYIKGLVNGYDKVSASICFPGNKASICFPSNDLSLCGNRTYAIDF